MAHCFILHDVNAESPSDEEITETYTQYWKCMAAVAGGRLFMDPCVLTDTKVLRAGLPHCPGAIKGSGNKGRMCKGKRVTS